MKFTIDTRENIVRYYEHTNQTHIEKIKSISNPQLLTLQFGISYNWHPAINQNSFEVNVNDQREKSKSKRTVKFP